jgi:predicted kinase
MSERAMLHFLCGKAGAGKSTLAQRLAREHDAMLLCEDVWLTRLFGDRMKTFEDYKLFSQRLKTVVGPLVIELLASGRSVVLDFPANTRTSRAWFRSVFEQAGVPHTLHYVDTPVQTCLERIAERNVTRPEGSHHLSEEDFAHVSSFFQAPGEEEGFQVKRYTAPPAS